MEKLNSGCEYCGSRGRDLQLLDGEGEPTRAYPPLSQVFIKARQIWIIAPSGNKFIDADYCMKCGRNLKTGNPMVEIKPLVFPSWEEFQDEHTHEYKIIASNYEFRLEAVTKIKEGKNVIALNVTMIDAFLDPLVHKYFDLSLKGYKKACEEIERIRLEFIIELVEG